MPPQRDGMARALTNVIALAMRSKSVIMSDEALGA